MRNIKEYKSRTCCQLVQGFACLFIFLSIFALASCERPNPLSPDSQEKGNLAIGLMLGPMRQDEESPINLLKAKAVDVSLKGSGIETIEQKIILETYGGKVDVSVPEGKNRAIVVAAKDALEKTQAVIKGYVDIIGEKTAYTTVSWHTTPVGEVIEELISRDYKKLDSYNPVELQNLVDQTVNEEKIHPIFINTDEIVEYILSNDKNPSSLSIITPIPIKGKVISKSGNPVAAYKVFANHPPFQIVTTDKDGSFQILPGVKPGQWTICAVSGEFVDIQVGIAGKVSPIEPVIILDIQDEDAMTIRGQCQNIYTGRGISQVDITTDFGMSKTDENGEFQIALENYPENLREIDWSANHNEFLPEMGRLTFSNGICDTGTILLIPIPKLVGEVSTDMGFNVPWTIVLNDKEDKAFVANKNGDFVSIIDTIINREIGTVGVGEMPIGMAYAGGRLYVANVFSKNISVVDPLQQIAVEGIGNLDSPAYIATDGKKLYVTLQDAISGNQVAVLRIDGDDLRLERRIPIGKFPQGIAINEIEGAFYAANFDWDNISRVDLTTGDHKLIPVGPNPQWVAVSPGGRYVYTADAGRISQIDTDKGTVVNRFLQSDARFGCVAVVELPESKGDLVYATDTAKSNLWMWYPDSEHTKAASVKVDMMPFGLVVTKDGLKIYTCASEGNTVQFLEIANEN